MSKFDPLYNILGTVPGEMNPVGIAGAVITATAIAAQIPKAFELWNLIQKNK